MDCEEIRDRFSALLENDLSPSTESEVRNHLASCPDCERDFRQFQKTMNWLHSMGDVEVPANFLEGIYRKLEEGKRVSPAGPSPEKKGFHLPLSLKLPVQAMAMVAIVFLALYVTRMTPMDSYRLKDTAQKEVPQMTARAPEAGKKRPQSESRAVEKEKAPTRDARVPEAKTELAAKPEKRLPGASLDEVTPTVVVAAPSPQPAPAAPAEEENLDSTKWGRPPLAKREVVTAESPRAKDEEVAKVSKPLLREEDEAKKVAAAKVKEMVPETFRNPIEMVVRASDMEKAIPQLQNLVGQFGGEILKQEGNFLFASLPASRLAEFERGLSAMSSSHRMEEGATKGVTDPGLRAAPMAMKRETGERVDGMEHVTVRIVLVSD